MAISPLRQAFVAAIAAICVAMLLVTNSSAEDADEPVLTHPIVARALEDLGTTQGQCWPWMREVVLDATGETVGFDYRQGFFDAGAFEIPLEAAGPGDIIQIADDGWTSPDADYNGLHTAIIMSANGDGTFTVIDSNSQWDETVRIREGYDPAAAAGRYSNLSFHIYRFIGEFVEAPAPKPPAPKPEPVVNHDDATVNTPGECLNLRTDSSTASSIITCLKHGTKVTVISDVLESGGMRWVQVQSPAGKGWVAANFLQKVTSPAEGAGIEAPPAASPSATPSPTPSAAPSPTPTPKPQFKLFIGGVGADPQE